MLDIPDKPLETMHEVVSRYSKYEIYFNSELIFEYIRCNTSMGFSSVPERVWSIKYFCPNKQITLHAVYDSMFPEGGGGTLYHIAEWTLLHREIMSCYSNYVTDTILLGDDVENQ